MKILALELSSPRGSIAVCDGSVCCFAVEFPNDRKHSGLFFENLQRCATECGRADLIVVGLGPGSYAGTRIAIAAAIGLQAATGARLGGITSTVSIATEEPAYIVIGDARRGSFSFARVENRRTSKEPELCSEIELRARLIQTSLPVFSNEPMPAFASTVIYPSALILAQIAVEPATALTEPPLEPIYLREPYITQPK